MMSKIDEIFKKVLNNREIFNTPYDKNKKMPIPKLFEGKSWKELGNLFNEKRKNEFLKKIDGRIKEIENREHGAYRWRRNKINELKQRAERLKSAFDNKPHLLADLFKNLEWYGLVKCKLPKMEDYGKVVERYDISIVKQFFIDKIKRAPYPQNRALEAVLEYIKELYTAGFSPEEMAYFVRKIDSLAKYWEVIE